VDKYRAYCIWSHLFSLKPSSQLYRPFVLNTIWKT